MTWRGVIGLLALGLAGFTLAAADMAPAKIGLLKEGPQAGHYLSWRDKPVLLIGDSVTQGWMECGTNFAQSAYVDALAARGLNLLMLWSFKGTSAEIQRADRRIGYDAPEVWPWAGSPDQRNFDLGRFNQDYFDRLKALAAYAERKGVVLLLTVHDGWTKTCFAGHPFNQALGNGPLSSNRQYVALADYERELPATFDASWNWRQRNQYFQEQFCAKLIAELISYSNVIYEMFNEGEWYDRTERRLHEAHFLHFFRQRCSNLLLSNTDHITGDDPHRDPNASGVSLHPRDWIGHFGKFAAGFEAQPPRPYFYTEPVPEWDGLNPPLEQVGRSVWETALAGAAWVNQNDPSFGWDRRTAIAAHAAARDRAYDLAGHAARFFNQGAIHFWEMAPAAKLASTGICLARPEFEYVVYAPGGGKFTVDLGVAKGAQFEARWFNPRSGAWLDGAKVTGGKQIDFACPGEGDWVLHLKRARP